MERPLLRDGLKRLLPRQTAWGVRAVCGLMLVGIIGCGRGDGRQAVEGTVSIDGTPLVEGAISFRPRNGQGPSAGGLVVQGKFVVPAENGLLPGEYQVQVIAMRATGKTIQDPQKGPVPELVPVRFANPPADVTVQEDGTNVFDVPMASAKR